MRSGFIESLMTLMPKNTIPSPISIAPYCLVRSCFEAAFIAKPTAIIASAALVTLKATIWAVIVVPMFAPMITEIDCDMDMRPAEMNPTTSTVVTDDD